jgi:hypothetical protein
MTLKPPDGTNTPQAGVIEPLNITKLGAAPGSASASAKAANYAAFASALAELGASGGSIFVPRGKFYMSAFPSLDKAQSVTIYGESGINGSSQLITTQAGAGVFISARSSDGVEIRDVALLHSSAFTGTLLDYSSLPAEFDTADMRVTNVRMSATGGAPIGATGMNLSKAILGIFRGVKFYSLATAVLGRALIADYSNSMTFEACTWTNIGTAPIRNMGSNWNLIGSNFQQLNDGSAAAIVRDAGFFSNGGSMAGGWCGDTIAGAPGTWVNWAGNGFVIQGVTFGHCAKTVDAGSDVASRGLAVMGNLFASSGMPITLGSGMQNLCILGNNFSGVNDIDQSAGPIYYSLLMGKTGFAGPLDFMERAAAPASPPANGARLYADDNGAGKTRLKLRTDSADNVVITSA